MEASKQSQSHADQQSVVPWEVAPTPAGPISDAAAAKRRSLPDPFSPVLDRIMVAVTIACAASLAFGSHGAHSSSTRELLPIMVLEPVE